jgi:polar amino acid transport system substrate-binding protein
LDAVISGVTMTPERNLDVAFVGPYFVSGKSVLAKAKTIKSVDESSDLDNPNMRLAVLKGSTSETFVSELLPNAKMHPITTYEEGVQLVLKDEVDALVADFPYCVLQVLERPEAKLVTLGEPFTYEPLGIAISGDDPLFTNLVTNFLITMEGTGRLFEMKIRWFSDGPWIDEMEPQKKPRRRKPGEQSASLERRVDG